VLSDLIGCETEGRFPPEQCGPLSLSAMARRFQVSRLHLSRMFQNAERAGLAHVDRDRFVTFTPRAQAEFAHLYAGQLAQLLSAAGRTAQAWEALATAA
jgi:Mn-dependent DtxR family transcriptional regulator